MGWDSMLMSRARVWVATGVLALGAASLSGCAAIDAQQREKGYRPTPGTLADWKPITARDEPVWLEMPAAEPGAPAQRLRAMWIPAADPAAPSVLYLHGTFRNMFQNRPKIAAISAAGFSVLAVDYRGWGESTSLLPSEETITQDSEVAWAEFTRRAPNVDSRVIFGHSMGSGVAVELALRHGDPPGYGAVVLESAMTSMPDMVRDYGTIGVILAPLVTQQFASIDKIDRISPPKWFMSGSADKVVPPKQTQRLFDAAVGVKHIEMFEGGSHSGLHQEFEQRYQAVWHDVAASLAGGHVVGAAAAASAPAQR
jgi:pimeloyl-ACP methyl ester carboxylesterase